MSLAFLEPWILRAPRGLASRCRLSLYRLLGLGAGQQNRMENVRCRRLAQVRIGDWNAFTDGCWLWPHDSPFDGVRIEIGSHNYFNRDVMIDACGKVQVGNYNMFGPGVYVTDSNHRL